MRDSFKLTKKAISNNLRPGILLWLLLVIFWISYSTSSKTQEVLQSIAELKMQFGYLSSFIAYFIFAALLPELLKVIFFQKGRVRSENLNTVLFGGIVFGIFGIISDLFFTFQAYLFGEGTDVKTLVIKTTVDQLSFSPFSCTMVLLLFMWKDAEFKFKFLGQVFSIIFFRERLLPMYAAMWMVWIPGVTLVYLMPSPLQLPISSFILCFWSLIITFMSRKDN